VTVCENFAAIDGAIAELDWRMAWEGDSYIAKGLYSAIDLAKSLKSDLVFLTDGHEMPPLPYSGLPPFVEKKGDVGGLIVGVGGRAKTPLPKHDDEGREIGSYSQTEVPQENREGPPPPDAASRPGYHPKWAPFGNAVVNNGEHLAFVREPYLQQLAAVTGLHYVLLDPRHDLEDAIAASAHARSVSVSSDIRALPAGGALALLAVLYGLMPLLDAWRARKPRAHALTSTS
jgi:mxaL protein